MCGGKVFVYARPNHLNPFHFARYRNAMYQVQKNITFQVKVRENLGTHKIAFIPCHLRWQYRGDVFSKKYKCKDILVFVLVQSDLT